MDNVETQSRIPESYFEHQVLFSVAWVDRWILPNPFISPLLQALTGNGVELADISFNKDATNLGDTYLNISIRKLNAAVRVGLNAITFIAVNPDWEMAPALVPTFDRAVDTICDVVHARPISQKTTLALHLIPAGAIDLREKTSSLLNGDLGAGSVFCGVSLHRASGALIIDKSLKYPDAAFIRIEREHNGEVSFDQIASKLYDDEVCALRLLGIDGID